MAPCSGLAAASVLPLKLATALPATVVIICELALETHTQNKRNKMQVRIRNFIL